MYCLLKDATHTSTQFVGAEMIHTQYSPGVALLVTSHSTYKVGECLVAFEAKPGPKDVISVVSEPLF